MNKEERLLKYIIKNHSGDIDTFSRDNSAELHISEDICYKIFFDLQTKEYLKIISSSQQRNLSIPIQFRFTKEGLKYLDTNRGIKHLKFITQIEWFITTLISIIALAIALYK